MTEEELLYEALRSPLGLVAKADRARLQKARAKLVRSDPAMLTLSVLGPDASGHLYVLRTDKAKENAK